MTTFQSATAAVSLVALAIVGSAVFVSSQSASDTREVPALAMAPTNSTKGTPGSADCPADTLDAFMRDSDSLLREFIDHGVRAGSGQRAELSPAVSDLQSTRRRFHALDAPPCAAAFKVKMEAGMDAMIDGALAWMSNQNANIDAELARSTREFTAAAQLREELLSH